MQPPSTVTFKKDQGSSSRPPPPPPFSYGPISHSEEYAPAPPFPFGPISHSEAYAPAPAPAPGTWNGATSLTPPYSMPNITGRKPWAAGGPVGTGSIPFDAEAQVMHEFASMQVRNGFMRKVFGIVTMQLGITVAFSLVCLFVDPLKDYVRSTPWPFYLSWGLSFGLLLVISCSERLRRKWPANMVLLGTFTIFQAFLVGMITSFFDIEAVMLAFLTTCVAVGVLTLIACQSKVDATGWGTYLMIPAAILLVLIFVGIFWISRVVYLVIAGVAALLAFVYLVYDLQLIMGGKNYAISPDEYIFAAMSVYIDIVQIFIWTLALIGWGRQ